MLPPLCPYLLRCLFHCCGSRSLTAVLPPLPLPPPPLPLALLPQVTVGFMRSRAGAMGSATLSCGGGCTCAAAAADGGGSTVTLQGWWNGTGTATLLPTFSSSILVSPAKVSQSGAAWDPVLSGRQGGAPHPRAMPLFVVRPGLPLPLHLPLLTPGCPSCMCMCMRVRVCVRMWKCMLTPPPPPSPSLLLPVHTASAMCRVCPGTTPPSHTRRTAALGRTAG